MKNGRLAGFISLLLCLVLVFSVVAPTAAEDAEEGCDSCQAYPIMHPDGETLERWIEAYNNAPRAYIKMEGLEVPSPGGSLDLLDHLEYTPDDRDQGSCGNCWAWAGTGCLEIALDVQEGIKDRLSIQYLNSCKSGDYACCGGWLSELADFYNITGEAIPWSNTNASWQDDSKSCASNSSDVDCASISKDPNYPITAIQETTIVTQNVTQAMAIANVKNVLNQDKAVWFGFFLPNNDAWTGPNGFKTFWADDDEDVVYAMDQFCGQSWGPEGGGHAVLCVGYNDDNPNNRYWIMLNSWGTTAKRPSGLFRINMDMAYNCTLPGLSHYYDSYAFMWQTLDVTFGAMPDISVSPSSFNVTLPPNTTQDYTLTISNDGDADLSYSISDYETTGVTAPKGVEAPELRQGEEEGQIKLMELNPSEPMSFAEPLLPFGGVQEEIAYDDDEAESSWAWDVGYAGNMFAVRFTPPSYPVSLETARICLWADWPDSDHEEFAMKVYDDNGAGGAPGTLLGSVNTTATAWGWWDVDISGLGITVISGDFYVGYKQTSDDPDCEALCADETAPDGRSWYWDSGWGLMSDLGYPLDWMIRCVVEEADCPWLSENPKSGTVGPGGSQDITISVDTTGLGSDYSAEIVIANNDPDENPKIVPVTLHVGAQAPTVTTNAATNEEETTATLNGVISSDGGEACQYQFEYDTDSGEPYAYNTGWTGSKTTGQSFNAPITSLSKGTKYYFRAQAKNSAGTGNGSELTFLTKPDAPTSFDASSAGTTQIDLSWTRGEGAQKTKIQRKQGSYPSNRDDGTQVYFDTGTSKSDTGLTPGTTYYYRAWSYVSGSEQWSDSYAEDWATTLAVTPPTVTTHAATLVEESTATLNGVVSDDGGEACQYQFEYDVDSGEPYAYNTGWTGSKSTGESFNAPITGLSKGKKYYFMAQTKNSAGTASGSELSFLTKPDAPTSFSAVTPSPTQINLSWTKGDGAQNTKIQRKEGSYPANKDDGTQVYFDTGSSKSDTGLTPGTTYYYRAWSYVSGSEEKWSDNYAQDSATTSEVTPPTVTTNAATNEEETTATLNGVISSDGGEACQYQFEYDTDSGEPYAYNTGWTGSKTTGQSFNAPITSLSKGTKYYFRAQAKNSAGTGSSSELTLLTKPDAPTSFDATSAGTTQINLSWAKGAGAQKTKIQRKQGSYPSNRDDGTQVYFDTGTSTSDTSLLPDTTYYYRAWSYVSGSEQWSDNCAEDSATTESEQPDISVAPITFNVTLPPDTSHNYTLTITNDGDANLSYDISDRETTGGGSGVGAGGQGPQAGPTKKDEAGAEAEGALQLAPINPNFLEFRENPPEPFYGYIPPPMDLSHLDEIPVERARGLATLPSSFDWRDTGKVTSVKDQSPCGTCWVFGTTSVLESAVLIGEDVGYDFSEQSVALCVDRSWVYLYDEADEPCDAGGWSWLASEVFIKKGAVLESCNPYDGSGLQCDGSCACDSCTPVKKADGYRYVTGDQSQTGLIKDAVYNHGPVTMAFYYDNSHKYTDATYGTVYDWASCSGANHLVSIIGWDDNVPHFETSGTGAWLVKNSWGTGWGNSGYFWLAYNSSCMTEIAYLEYKDYDPNETLYYWDEAGMIGAAGCGGPSAWMANIFTSAQEGSLTHVDFWTTSNNAQYEIYVYLDGDISDGLQNQVASQSGTCQELGYYSIPLTSPVALTSGQPFIIAVKMATTGWGYPIPVEYEIPGFVEPPIQTGVSYARWGDTSAWGDVGLFGGNVCLRGRVTTGGEDCPWLDENPTSGSVEPATSDEITVTIDTTGLAEGDYSAEIVIDNNDRDENPTTVPVTLRVSVPYLAVDITYPENDDKFYGGEEPEEFVLTAVVKNVGDVNYTDDIGVDMTAVGPVTPTSGSTTITGGLAAGESSVVTFTMTAGVTTGNAVITVTATGPNTALDVVTVKIDLEPTQVLYAGANPIAYRGKTMSLPEALTNISDKLEIIWQRDVSTGGEWHKFYFYHGIPVGEITELVEGKAYIVVVTEDCTWKLPR